MIANISTTRRAACIARGGIVLLRVTFCLSATQASDFEVLGARQAAAVQRAAFLESSMGGESAQDSLNACGVRPVHRRNDRWNAAGSEYCRKNAMSPMLRLRS